MYIDLIYFLENDPLTLDRTGELNFGHGTYRLTELNVIRTADKAVVVWLCRDRLYANKQQLVRSFCRLTNAERIYAHTNMIACFDYPHDVIGKICRDHLIDTNCRDRAYATVAKTLQFLRDRLNYSPPVAHLRGAGYDALFGSACAGANSVANGDSVPHFEPLAEELRTWTSIALAADANVLPPNFVVPPGRPSLGYISDQDWFVGNLLYYFHCPSIASVISTPTLGRSFEKAVLRKKVTVRRLKDIRRYARTGRFSINNICGVFLGADATSIAPFFLWNPRHTRSLWDVIKLFFTMGRVIEDLRLGVCIPLSCESRYTHFISRKVPQWVEESRRDHSIVREVDDSFFDVTTETRRVQDHSYKLRYCLPILSE
jgi:hypothetical protein